MRARERRDNKPAVIKFILLILICTVFYYLGYGHGQSSTYNKINDDRELGDVYKFKGE